MSSNSTSPTTGNSTAADPSDCAIVRQFKFTPSVVTPSQPSCCSGISMRDVRCSTNNRVTFLVLYGNENDLKAGIPESVGQLDALETFELYNASGTAATIPTSISRLTNLKLLNFVNVSLTGSIPDSFAGMKRLEHLGLNNNKLSGAVPSSIGSLTALKKLYFYDNQLTSMPDNLFANMPYLEILAFHINQFSGKLPSSIGSLKKLTALSIRDNKFTGTIPQYFNDMPDMKELYLGDNEFTGIPDPFMPNRRMYSLRIDGNKITGALPILPYTNDTCRIDGPDDRNSFVCSRAANASDQLGECYKLSEVRGLSACQPGQAIPSGSSESDDNASGFSTGLIAGLVGAAAVAIVAGFFLFRRRGKKSKPTIATSTAGHNTNGPPTFGYNSAPSNMPQPVSVAHTGGSVVGSTVAPPQSATWAIPTTSAPPTLTPPPGYQTNPTTTTTTTTTTTATTPTANINLSGNAHPGLASYNPYAPSKPTVTAPPPLPATYINADLLQDQQQQRPQSFMLPSAPALQQQGQRPQSFASPSTILMPQPPHQPTQPMLNMPQPQLAMSPGPASPTYAPNQQQQPLLYSNPTSATASPLFAASAHPHHAPLPHTPSAPPMPTSNIASPLLSATTGGFSDSPAHPAPTVMPVANVPAAGPGIEMQSVSPKDDKDMAGHGASEPQVTHVATFDSSTLALPGRPPQAKEEDETLYLG